MINHLLFLTAALCLLGGSACVTSAVPQVIIPKNAGQLDISAGLASNGAQMSLLYATGKRHFITGSYHRSVFREDDYGTIYGELGAGLVMANGRTSASLSFGHGKFGFYPHFVDIKNQFNPFTEYYGHYFRTSLTLNTAFRAVGGVTNRVDLYKGTENGITYYGSFVRSFYDRSVFGINYEPAFYFKSFKRSGVIVVIGLDFALYASHKETDPVFFRVPNYFISIGYHLNVLKGHRALGTEPGKAE